MESIIEINDSNTITSILNKAFITVAHQFNITKENAPRFPAFINSDIIDGNIKNGLKMYGYKNDEEIVGCVGYSYYKDEIYFIERLATIPEYRHLGIGKKLMEFAESKIFDKGGKIAEIHVVDKNNELRTWYKSIGYIEIRIDELKTFPFNSCVMYKDLK